MVPWSSGGSTSGSRGNCLAPGQHPRNTEGKRGGIHHYRTGHMQTGAGGAGTGGGAETQGCRPLGHQHQREHPQATSPGPLPPSTIRHTLSRRWQRGGGEPHLWEACAGLGLTCEIRRYSCAFCRQDQNSGLCCAPAWKGEKGLRCSAAYVCMVAGPWMLLVTPSHPREPGANPPSLGGLGFCRQVSRTWWSNEAGFSIAPSPSPPHRVPACLRQAAT